MKKTGIFAVLNAKYLHASPAPFCLMAGVKAYSPELYSQMQIFQTTIKEPTQKILERICALKPTVVGFSCYIWNIEQTLAVCAEIKRAMPNTVIILGGPEVSYNAKNVLEKHSYIDYISCGEGEKSIPAFLRAVFSAPMPQLLLPCERENIAGLVGRNKDGTIYENEIKNLGTDVPSPITAGYCEEINGRISYFETSRGCPYSCAFCLSGRLGGVRFYDLDKCLPELLLLANSGTQTIKFVDRTFNANAKHANRILQFILDNYGTSIPTNVCFHFEIAGDILREETFDILEKMPVGAVQLEIGMQSFHEPTLEAINRKTNSEILQKNIRRLVAMGNMHIHIDLIAGLPLETLSIFAESFNTGYLLGAEVMQLGFLKILHGCAMRDKPEQFPCSFTNKPPYQITQTPWLSQRDLEVLQNADDALDRVHNSGRLRRTADYLLKATGKTPFELYSEIGENITHDYKVSLDEYTEKFKEYAESLISVTFENETNVNTENMAGIDKEILRDNLVRDRLSTNSFGKLPSCLARFDERLPRIKYLLSQNKETAPHKGVKRGIAILYGAQTVCWADYCDDEYNRASESWKLHEMKISDIID